MKKKRNVVTWWGAKKIEKYWHHQSFERWNTIISKTQWRIQDEHLRGG